jgi:ABC-type glycerol-3-phosphate transport system permease component
MAGVPALPSRVRARPLTRRRLTDLAAAAILSCLAFVGLFPYLYMLQTAVKSDSQFNSNEATPTWPLHLGNFATAWREVAPYLLSSIIVAACVTFGCILLGSVTGFVLARYRFPGRNFFFGLIALLLMVPNMASLIPLFVLMRDLGLLDSYPDLIIPQLTTQTVFSVVLMKTYIEHLPEELFDAAQIAGASPARTYWSVTLPLARPIIGGAITSGPSSPSSPTRCVRCRSASSSSRASSPRPTARSLPAISSRACPCSSCSWRSPRISWPVSRAVWRWTADQSHHDTTPSPRRSAYEAANS